MHTFHILIKRVLPMSSATTERFVRWFSRGVIVLALTVLMGEDICVMKVSSLVVCEGG